MKTRSFALGLALFLSASSAAAVEKQHHVGASVQLATLTIDDKSTQSSGAGVMLHYTYGMSDTWNLMVEASSSVVALHQNQDTPDTPRTRPSGVDQGGVGVGYVIDVLRWVPYLSLLGGAYRLHGGTLAQDLWLAGVSAGAGLDYQLSRSFAVGIGVREHLMLSKLGTYPSYFTAFLRGEYMWGW